jgi:6-phosphogluconolactonase
MPPTRSTGSRQGHGGTGEATAGTMRTFADGDEMAAAAGEWLCGLARSTDRTFAVCLSGGSTPRRLYTTLAGPAIAHKFPWRRVHWFWGDERFVPRDHPDSNYRMVYEALLARAPVPDANIHPVAVDGTSPQRAAVAYEQELKRFHGADRLDPERPLFDVTLLGLGEDGHTASLFPGHAALHEQRRWVVAVVGATPPARISLTFPVLDSSRDVAFLVTGDGKRSILARARAGDPALPAAHVRPVGRLHWFVDRAAAGGTPTV